MRAAVLNQLGGSFQIEPIQIDRPRGREVMIDVKASGLCHSDLHIAEADFGVPLPAVLGHELAGVVQAVGPEVREFKEGDRVVGSLIQFCGHCAACLSGHTYRCIHPDETLRSPHEPQRLWRGETAITQLTGTGAFAEQALVHENQLAKVPAEMPFAQASLLGCGTITGVGAAIHTSAVRPGDSVAIIGIGGVGLNVISGARLCGAGRIVAIDTYPGKESLAMKFGATDFINARDQDPISALQKLIPGGVDHCFEVVGTKTTSEQALRMVRKGGGLYLIGVHRPGSKIELDVTLDLLANQVRVQGVYMGSTNIKHDIPLYARLYLQGRLNLDDLISREIKLDDINDAYQELKKGAIARSVITAF
jgi:S-(hydroxymethyl)glutathione dehydrogenase / alcohol dehydrogenase